jgi:hypothetical protein
MSGQVPADCCVEQFALGAGRRPFFCLGKAYRHRSGTAKPWDFNRSSSGGWFENSEAFEYLGQLLSTFLEKLFPEMI